VRGTIAADSEALDSVFDEHLNISGTVGKAHKILSRMERQDELDQWLMCASTTVFIVVLLFVIIRRTPGIGIMIYISRVVYGHMQTSPAELIHMEAAPELLESTALNIPLG